MSKGPFVTKLDLSKARKLRAALEERGFALSQPAYTLFAGRKPGVSCTLYESGKLVVQGKEMGEFIEFFLEPEILETVGYGYESLEIDRSPRMGSDEAGKGDFFGPLVVASLFAEGDGVTELVDLGVTDSKRIADDKVIRLARKLRATYPFHVLRLMPTKYNELYDKFGNLNLLLAWAHAAALESLYEKTKCSFALVDQFAREHVLEKMVARRGLAIQLTQRTKAESDPVVAAASILARAGFLEGLDELSRGCGTTLPKGAGSPVIRAARSLYLQAGPDLFPSIAKIHFKTYRETVDSGS
jgi:ribonuclease HIII